MMIHEITELAGGHRQKRRVGRGVGSGRGKTSGRGHKGARSRSGYARRAADEGGQKPYFRRIPKRGFTNAPFKTEHWVVNLSDIVAHADFAKGGEVNAERLIKAGLIRDTSRPLKVLADLGEGKALKVKLTVKAARASKKVRELVVAAGGSVVETGTRRDRVRGVDRNSEDQRPKNLTKKLNRAKKKGKKKAGGGEAEAAEAPAADKPGAEKPEKKGA